MPFSFITPTINNAAIPTAIASISMLENSIIAITLPSNNGFMLKLTNTFFIRSNDSLRFAASSKNQPIFTSINVLII